jgi:hypothetical protein
LAFVDISHIILVPQVLKSFGLIEENNGNAPTGRDAALENAGEE